MASFNQVSREITGTGQSRPVIKGDYIKNANSATSKMDMSGTLTARTPKHQKYFTPQRLYVTAPLDEYGIPLRQFTIQSKLLNQLPPNCTCHVESFSMNNFVGYTQPNMFGSFKATITAQTISTGGTVTLTIISNPNNLNISGQGAGGLITFKTAEGYNFIGYVSTPSNSTPVITIINPGATSAVVNNAIPAHQFPVFNTNNAVAAQTVVCDYTWKECVASAQNDIGKIQIELLDYTNPEVFDSATGQYSNIIGVVPTQNGDSVEIDWYENASINNAGYPITDPNLINNRQLTFRLSYATPTGNVLLPPQAAQGQVYPYNLTDVSIVQSSSGIHIPWGGTISALQYTGGNAGTAKVFPLAPCIRFALVFLPMYGITKEYE